MKAEIDAIGTLTITPETPAEAYALRCWNRSQEGEHAGVLFCNYNAPFSPCAEDQKS